MSKKKATEKAKRLHEMLILKNYEKNIEDIENQMEVVKQRKAAESVGKGQHANYLLNNRRNLV